jgi:hypothetical protein
MTALADPPRFGLHRITAAVYFIIIALVASLNYLPIPGIIDENGLCFGIFALDPFDDLLHVGSALWALAGAWISTRAARIFLICFGALYLLDGLMGFATGVGFLDLGIIRWGVQPFDLTANIFASIPHVGLGIVAFLIGLARPE